MDGISVDECNRGCYDMKFCECEQAKAVFRFRRIGTQDQMSYHLSVLAR